MTTICLNEVNIYLCGVLLRTETMNMKSVLVAIVCMMLTELCIAQRIGVAKLMHPFKSQYDKLDIQQDFEETIKDYNKKVDHYEFVFVYDEIPENIKESCIDLAFLHEVPPQNEIDSYIIARCAQYKLDALLLSRMKMVVQPASIKNGNRELIKTGESYVEMVLFDKDARIITRTIHNTDVQNVNIAPNPRKTLKQAVRSCLRRICNNFDWERRD